MTMLVSQKGYMTKHCKKGAPVLDVLWPSLVDDISNQLPTRLVPEPPVPSSLKNAPCLPRLRLDLMLNRGKTKRDGSVSTKVQTSKQY